MRSTPAFARILPSLCALALLLAFGACESDDSTVGTSPDTATGVDTGGGGGGTVDTGGGGGTVDTGGGGGTVDTGGGGTTDAGPQPIPAGQLGGECKPGGVCDEGECWSPRPEAVAYCVTPCTGNHECPDHLRCEEVAEFEMKCVPGARGTGEIGDPCGEGMENGCASALCVEADPSRAIHVATCTAPCARDADCHAPFPVCFGGVNLCLPILSGDLGGRCPAGEACREGSCELVTDLGERCTMTCAEDADCGQTFLSCQQIGMDRWCLMTPRP